MKLLCLLLAALALSGCTTTYTQPTLPADHPANAAAEEAPPPTRWQTLDLAAADPITPAQAGHGVDHGGAGHDMGDRSGPKPTEPAIEAAGHKHEAPAPPATAAMYVCPMHPEVTSDKPDQRCPECGTKLKPIPAPAPASGGPK